MNEGFKKILGDLILIHKYIKKEAVKTKAYEKALFSINEYNKEIKDSKELLALPNVGKKIKEKYEVYQKTNTLPMIEEHKSKLVAIRVFSKIHGLGPSKITKLLDKDILTLEDLKKHENDKDIKLTSSQRLGLTYYEDINERIPRVEIKKYDALFTSIMKSLGNSDDVLTIMGSYRRKQKTSGDIDVLISNKKNNNQPFIKFRDVLEEKKIIKHFLRK